MAIEKITSPITANFLINKVNNIIDNKQDTLTPGTGINITNDVIGVDSEQVNEITLATVATTGDYDDLSNKPTIPTVNNATLTITQGGVSKGTFTANAAVDATIALDSATVSYDNSTINKNSSNQLQAIGVVDKNSTNDQKLGFWCGTQSQWETGATVVFYDWTRQGEGFNVTQRPWFTGKAIINTGTYYIAACYNHISISSAGTSWNNVYQSSVDTNSTEALAYDGNNTVVMVGNNVGAVSTDGGENWNEDYNWGGYIDVTCATINNTPTFLAIDQLGGLFSSTDGTTITAVNTLDWDTIQPETAGMDPHVISIYSYNGTVRILTKQGKVAVSTDGLATWTAEQIGSYTTDYPNLWVKLSCFEANGTWVALKADGTVYYNSGSGWVEGDSLYSMVDPNNGVTYKSIAYDNATNNEKMIALASDGSLKYTTNGTTSWAAMTKLVQPDEYNYYDWNSICSNGSGGFCAVTVYGTALWGTVTEYVYTRNARPDMWEITYSAPNTSSGYDDGNHRVQNYDSANNQITLSNGNVYTYDSPVNGTGSIGEVYPNYISYLTDTQEIRKGGNTIANGKTVTVDQNYYPWSQNAQSGVAVAQAIASISPSVGLSNTATGANSLTILGTPTSADSTINIGKFSQANGSCGVVIGVNARADNNYSVAIGQNATTQGQDTTAIGAQAQATTQESVAIGAYARAYDYNGATAIGTYARCNGAHSIQIGNGRNSEDNTLKVGLGESDGQGDYINYTLLGTTGLIPVDRLTAFTGADGTNAGTKGAVPAPTATDNDKFLKGDGTWASGVQLTSNLVTSVSSSSTDNQYPSAKCVYDIVGDIETLLSQI